MPGRAFGRPRGVPQRAAAMPHCQVMPHNARGRARREQLFSGVWNCLVLSFFVL